MKRFAVVVARLEPQDGTAPEWMLLYPAGWNEVVGEESFLVDREAYDLVAGYLSRRGNDVVIDYEHATLTDGVAPAAGWIKTLRWDAGKGIMARVDWTQKAAAYIAAKEYRYFSPVSIVRKSDHRLIAIHSVAMTNAPRTNNLTPILAKLGADTLNPTKEESMDWFKKLFAALGLADGASEEDVLTAVAKMKKPEVKEVVAKAVLDALDLSEGDTSTVVASIHALKQGTRQMVSREEFDRLQKELAQRDAKAVVAKALAEGKVTPDQREWAEAYAAADAAGFATFVAKAPAVIPLRDLPGKKDLADQAALDEATVTVAKMMGVAEEDIKKYAAN